MFEGIPTIVVIIALIAGLVFAIKAAKKILTGTFAIAVLIVGYAWVRAGSVDGIPGELLNMLMWLIEGLKSFLPEVAGWIESLFNSAMEAVKNAV